MIYSFIQKPSGWQGPEPTEDEKQQIFDRFAQEVGQRLLQLSTTRLKVDRRPEWDTAYFKQGLGSARERSLVIAHQIYDKAAAIPDITPSPESTELLDTVVKLLQEAAETAEVELR